MSAIYTDTINQHERNVCGRNLARHNAHGRNELLAIIVISTLSDDHFVFYIIDPSMQLRLGLFKFYAFLRSRIEAQKLEEHTFLAAPLLANLSLWTFRCHISGLLNLVRIFWSPRLIPWRYLVAPRVFGACIDRLAGS